MAGAIRLNAGTRRCQGASAASVHNVTTTRLDFRRLWAHAMVTMPRLTPIPPLPSAPIRSMVSVRRPRAYVGRSLCVGASKNKCGGIHKRTENQDIDPRKSPGTTHTHVQPNPRHQQTRIDTLSNREGSMPRECAHQGCTKGSSYGVAGSKTEIRERASARESPPTMGACFLSVFPLVFLSLSLSLSPKGEACLFNFSTVHQAPDTSCSHNQQGTHTHVHSNTAIDSPLDNHHTPVNSSVTHTHRHTPPGSRV